MYIYTHSHIHSNTYTHAQLQRCSVREPSAQNAVSCTYSAFGVCVFVARLGAMSSPAVQQCLPSAWQGAVLIDDWQLAWAGVDRCVLARPMCDTFGQSRKSPTGGHYSPWEIEVFIDATGAKRRLVTGLTTHGGFLHVYLRSPPKPLVAAASAFFAEAVGNLRQMTGRRRKALANFDGDEWGPEYLKFRAGDVIGWAPPLWMYPPKVGLMAELAKNNSVGTHRPLPRTILFHRI